MFIDFKSILAERPGYLLKKGLKIPKGLSEAVNQRKTDNTMEK